VQLTSETDKQWLAYLHAELGPDLGVLPRILAHWKTTGKAIVTRSTAQSAVDGYLDYRKAQVSARTLADNRCRLSRFKVQLGDRQLSDLIPADFRGFLDSFTDRTSRRNYYKSLAPWVKLCVEKRLLVINPLSEIKRPKANEGEPEVYSVDAFQALLKHAGAETIAFVAIGGLAGLRTAEMLRERRSDQVLQWEDVDFQNRRITVRPEVLKTDRRRYEPICGALISWLEPIAKQSGSVLPVSQAAFRKHMQKLFEQTKTKAKPIDNGLRHSFASYWLALNGGEQGGGALANVMGNSESVARRHYVEVLTPESGEKMVWDTRGTNILKFEGTDGLETHRYGLSRYRYI
jgi:integrase